MKSNLKITIWSMVVLFLGIMSYAEPIDVSHGVADPDGKTVWYDGQLLTIEGKGWKDVESYYDRLPAKAKGVAPEHVWNLSHDSAGLCLRFITDASSIQVRWVLRSSDLAMAHMPATGVSGVDLYGKDENGVWRFLANGRPEDVTNTVAFNLEAGRENLLYLPLYNGVKTVEIGVPKDKTISPSKPASRKYNAPIVFYGTSITQGGCASRPGLAATAIVGRELDAPIINLGFSGSGKMEPEMADLLCELDPFIYVLDCIWNMTPDMVQERVEPFVKKLRQAHPDTPILLAEDSSVRNTTPTEKGRILRTVFEKMTKDGIQRIYFLSNKGMLGTDWEGTVDGCHPNDLGMMRQAEVFVEALKPLMKE